MKKIACENPRPFTVWTYNVMLFGSVSLHTSLIDLRYSLDSVIFLNNFNFFYDLHMTNQTRNPKNYQVS